MNKLANLTILLFTLSLFLSLFPLDESDKLEGLKNFSKLN